MNNTHINVTVDARALGGAVLDLRIPALQKVGDLIVNVLETLNIADNGKKHFIRIPTKKCVLLEHQTLKDGHVNDGDILEIN